MLKSNTKPTTEVRVFSFIISIFFGNGGEVLWLPSFKNWMPPPGKTSSELVIDYCINNKLIQAGWLNVNEYMSVYLWLQKCILVYVICLKSANCNRKNSLQISPCGLLCRLPCWLVIYLISGTKYLNKYTIIWNQFRDTTQSSGKSAIFSSLKIVIPPSLLLLSLVWISHQCWRIVRSLFYRNGTMIIKECEICTKCLFHYLYQYDKV